MNSKRTSKKLGCRNFRVSLSYTNEIRATRLDNSANLIFIDSNEYCLYDKDKGKFYEKDL
ncbi:hypothetical protein GCM10027170_28500 [Aliiglaciecola aliphaticivorans]